MAKNIEPIGILEKIIMVGLDNSGKTSILLCMKGNNNLLAYNAEPTRGITQERIFIGTKELSIWELGGQQYERKEHLEGFNTRADGTDTLIFVCDVQDTERYGIAIDYFTDIINKFREISSFPKVILFLHKYDISLDYREKFSIEYMRENIINHFKKIVGDDFLLTVYKTTIQTLFTKSEIL